jgi:hypothetical protein
MRGNFTLGGTRDSQGTLAFVVPQGVSDGVTLLALDGRATVSNAVLSLAWLDDAMRSALDWLVLLDAEDDGTVYDLATLSLAGADSDMRLVVDPSDGTRLLVMRDGTIRPVDAGEPAIDRRLGTFAASRMALVGLLNRGQDLLTEQGLARADRGRRGDGAQWNTFAAADGSRAALDLGNGGNVDLTAQVFVAGLGVSGDSPAGRLSLAAFVESGWGSHRTDHDFGQAGGANGKGSASYLGGGLLARLDAPNGLHATVAGRHGHAHLTHRTGAFTPGGFRTSYDTDAGYWGADAGMGWTAALPGTEGKGKVTLDGKALWTHLDRASVTAGEDRVSLAAVDSLRTRLGARVTYDLAETVSAYAGIHWEHAFLGKQRIAVNGARLPSPTLAGDTGIAEAGLSFRPAKDAPLAIEIGVQRYAGKVSGYGGTVQLVYAF